MKFLFPALALVLFMSADAEAQIFKFRKYTRCIGNRCRVVHHPTVYYQTAVVTQSDGAGAGVQQIGSCTDERNAWEQADVEVKTAVVARDSAVASKEETAAELEAARAALAAAEAADAAAAEAVIEAQAGLVAANQAASAAYAAWLECVQEN